MDAPMLSRKARELLEAGCASPNSRPVALRSEAEKFFQPLNELYKSGFLIWQGEHPYITAAGRAAIGAPSENVVALRALREQYGRPTSRPAPSRRSNERIVMVLALDPERETTDAWFASCDGDKSKALAIPKRPIEVRASDEFGFCVAVMPAWVAIERKMSQANYPALTRSVKWTAEQRAAWHRMRSLLAPTRNELRHRAKTKTYEKMPYGYTA